MKYLEVSVPEDHAYLIPISDIHWSDPSFKKGGKQKLKGYCDWVMERPNAFIFLMGDVYNVASRYGKTSPFEIEDTDEYEEAINFFEPYKSRIIGAITGNHEFRIEDEFGINPLQFFCKALEVPYCKYSAVIRFKVGKRKNAGNRYYQNYFVYAHHSTGGGGTIGGKLNRVVKLGDIVEGCDLILGAHNHQLAVAPRDVFYPSIQGGIMKRRIWYVDCGGYLEYDDSYAEKAMLVPAKTGSPRIRFSGKEKHHDVHCSL